jgi:hypothetical protein
MDVFRYLMENRNSVAKIPDHPAPGVYAIFAKNRDALPGIDLPLSGLIYIGLSSDLEQRNHFKAQHSAFHSPRRSIGAILKTMLNLTAIPRSAGSSATNYRNFRFKNEGEHCLVKWMTSNLQYSIYPFDGNVDELETQLIRENKPPLNLTKWHNPQKQKIQALRRACREEAKLAWQKHLGCP